MKRSAMHRFITRGWLRLQFIAIWGGAAGEEGSRLDLHQPECCRHRSDPCPTAGGFSTVNSTPTLSRSHVTAGVAQLDEDRSPRTNRDGCPQRAAPAARCHMRRLCYHARACAYAVVWFPQPRQLSRFMQGWKRISSQRIKRWYREHRPKYYAASNMKERFWQAKYYPYEIYTQAKLREKVTYMPMTIP